MAPLSRPRPGCHPGVSPRNSRPCRCQQPCPCCGTALRRAGWRSSHRCAWELEQTKGEEGRRPSTPARHSPFTADGFLFQVICMRFPLPNTFHLYCFSLGDALFYFSSSCITPACFFLPAGAGAVLRQGTRAAHPGQGGLTCPGQARGHIPWPVRAGLQRGHGCGSWPHSAGPARGRASKAATRGEQEGQTLSLPQLALLCEGHGQLCGKSSVLGYGRQGAPERL